MPLDGLGRQPQVRHPPQDRADGDCGLQPGDWRAVRSTTAIYIETEQDGGTFREFYDLRRDPYQLDNLAGSDRRVADYAAALKALRRCAGQDCNRVAVPTG